eukprot:NODE_153_length_15389_cov_1.201439.p15 type:complete len:146 gc:universal NODE_153_length_15389_cov_1.201439:10619-10182(-)
MSLRDILEDPSALDNIPEEQRRRASYPDDTGSFNTISTPNINTRTTSLTDIESQYTMDASRRQFLCSICNTAFTERSSVVRHLRNVHSAREPCPYCGKSLKTKGRADAMRSHLIRCHVFLKQIGTNDKNEIFEAASKVTRRRSNN